MATQDFRKLEELAVIFVSGVKHPATNKHFVLMKEARWEHFVKEVLAQNPELAARLEALLEAEDYTGLAKAIEEADPLLKEEAQAVLNYFTGDGAEPSVKELQGEGLNDITALALLYKREWPQKKRLEHKKRGGAFAGPGLSFPIASCEDVHAAYMAAGRAKGDPDTIRRNVIRIAQEKGWVRCLPQSVQAQLEAEKEVKVKRQKYQDETEEIMEPVESETGTDEFETAVPSTSRRKTKKGIMGSLAEMVARGAGYEVVPAGTTQTLKYMHTVLEAMLDGKSLTTPGPAGVGEETWPVPHDDDDVPVGADFDVLPDRAAVPGQAPTDGMAWEEPFRPLVTKAAPQQNPTVVAGKPVEGAPDRPTVVLGNPVSGPPRESQVALGTPVTKTELEELMATLKEMRTTLKALDERVRVVEELKGISHARVVAKTGKSNGSIWAGSAFDIE